MVAPVIILCSVCIAFPQSARHFTCIILVQFFLNQSGLAWADLHMRLAEAAISSNRLREMADWLGFPALARHLPSPLPIHFMPRPLQTISKRWIVILVSSDPPLPAALRLWASNCSSRTVGESRRLLLAWVLIISPGLSCLFFQVKPKHLLRLEREWVQDSLFRAAEHFPEHWANISIYVSYKTKQR